MLVRRLTFESERRAAGLSIELSQDEKNEVERLYLLKKQGVTQTQEIKE